MLNQEKNKKWATMFLFTMGTKARGKSYFNDVFAKMAGKQLAFQPVSTYNEQVTYKKNKDGTFYIDSGHWKGRLTTSNYPIIETVKVNLQKQDKSDFTLNEFQAIRSQVRPALNTALHYDMNPGKLEHLNLAYYPFKDPFGVDKGLPKNPSLPSETNWLLAAAAVIGIGLVYNYNK